MIKYFLLLFIFVGCAKTYTVPLQKDNTAYVVRAKLNGVEIPMLLDTGATTSNITLNLIDTLNVKISDTLKGRWYILADGSEQYCPVFKLRTLELGNLKLKNIECNVSVSPNSIILLGNDVLKKFKRVKIDNKHKKLILVK